MMARRGFAANMIPAAVAASLALLLLLGAATATFTWAADSVSSPASAAGGIASGTTITTSNWQQYRQFMPEGMQALFEGKYAWKMPPDVQIVVGPTVIHPLPTGYVEATNKYAPKVQMVALPDGGFTIKDYVAGAPFPNPSEPHKGWKVLADVWFRYIPHIIAATQAEPTSFCLQDRYDNITCDKTIFVYHQLMHNTDPGVPRDNPEAAGRWYTEWSMIVEPEQLKYTASLTLLYDDLTKPQDTYAFVPELRRVLRQNASSRCGPVFGSDFTRDDVRYGFNGEIPTFSSKYLRDQKILALSDYNMKAGAFPAEYYMPLGWPKPSWGQWELRDTYVIDVRRLPSQAQGYCYGKRVMYVDKETFAPLWEDLYDVQGKFWKIMMQCPRARMVPGLGIQTVTGSSVSAIWDLQNRHAARFVDPTNDGRDVLMNQQVPVAYQSIERYGGPTGLNEIMR